MSTLPILNVPGYKIAGPYQRDPLCGSAGQVLAYKDHYEILNARYETVGTVTQIRGLSHEDQARAQDLRGVRAEDPGGAAEDAAGDVDLRPLFVRIREDDA